MSTAHTLDPHTSQQQASPKQMTVTRFDTTAIPDQTGKGRPAVVAPSPAPTDFDCGPLLLCLKDEQAALEFLLYKLRVQNLLLGAGDVLWLPASNVELDGAIEKLSVVGQRREHLAAAANQAHGLAFGRLKDLAGRVADEWACQQLMQRQTALHDLLEKVRRCSKQNQQMLAHGLAATNDALSILGRVPTYNAAGSVARTTPSISIDTRA